MKFLEYLNKIMQDVSCSTERIYHDVFNQELERFMWVFNSRCRFAFINSGRYITYKATLSICEQDVIYILVFRSEFGQYRLIKSGLIVKNYYGHWRLYHDYKPKYILNEFNNVLAEVHPDYNLYDWDEWQDWYKENITSC